MRKHPPHNTTDTKELRQIKLCFMLNLFKVWSEFRWKVSDPFPNKAEEYMQSSMCSGSSTEACSSTLCDRGTVAHRCQFCGPPAALRLHPVRSWLRTAAQVQRLRFEDRFLHRSMSGHSSHVQHSGWGWGWRGRSEGGGGVGDEGGWFGTRAYSSKKVESSHQ